MKRTILKIVLVLTLISFVVCIGGIYSTTKQYKDSIATYEKLEQLVSIENNTPKELLKVEDSNDSAEAEEEIQEVKLINVDFEMDFDALKEINSDVVGWIYYEPIELSYPIVMDRGDDFYENYTFELVKNVAGAIFMDYACRPSMDGFNTIIYGHNMRNGTMFGSLKKLLNDTSIIEGDPYFYIFTDKYAFMYKIICAYHTPASSKTYELYLDGALDKNKEYIDYMNSVAEYRDEEFFNSEITDETKIVTLSTCHGLHSGNRTVIHGVLIAKEDR